MKEIKVFISSTFNDLVTERNKIMLAFREAERYAIKNYINLKTIDYRWGLPDGAHVMKSCLESIHISKPYFLCILGDNYGSQPKWEDYEKEREYLTEYNRFIEDNVFKSKPENNLSYTAMEVYFTLSQGFGKDNVCFLHLAYKNEADSRQKELIRYVNEKGYSIVECSTPDELVKEVSQFLTSIIDNNTIIVVDDEEDNKAQKYLFGGFNGSNTQHGQLSLYRKSQEYYLNSKLLDSFSREQENVLEAFVKSKSTICCIEGEDGVGKSSLVARWLSNRIKKNDSNEIIIYHFCQGGYTDDIFEHLYLELAEINNQPLEDYYAELFSTNEHFPDSFLIFKEAIKQLESDKQILFVLDGIEHTFEAFFSSFFDLFSETSQNIKLVLTTGTSRRDPYDCETLQLPCLKEDEAKYIIINYLKAHYKTDDVSNRVAEVLVFNPILHNPKLLLSVLYDIRAFANHNNINNIVTEYKKANDGNAVYSIIISHWRNIMPSIDVNNILVWIAYSHFGMAEEDIKNVAGFIGDKVYLWHQLYSFIEPYIEWNGDRIQFSNKWLKETIVKGNLKKEKEIKNLMISYFQEDSISIEKQFDELPYLLKETNRYDELLSYLLNLSVFQYANGEYKKRCVLIDFWSVFELSHFSNYLYLSHDGMSKKDYVLWLYELSEFLYFNGIKMFPEEERFDIESLHSMICQSIINELDDVIIKEIEPAQIANVYRSVAVSYLDSCKVKEARNLLEKGIKLLSPMAKEKWELYQTTLMIHQRPEFISFDDKVTMSYVESITRTSVLKILNPYIDLLGEMINTCPIGNKLKKYYNEVMECIDKLDLMQETGRNTALLRSTIEYGYGMNLYEEGAYCDAFEKFNKAFNLRYDYLLKEESYLRNDIYQEYRLMETYKMIESCQIGIEGISELFNNQGRYVEAVEKYGKNLIAQGRFDFSHYCNCIYNYAAFFYNQTVGRDDNEVKELLQKALKYYDKVVSETKNGLLKDMYIRASFFKIMCLSRMDKDDDVPEIFNSILETEKTLSDFERNDNQVAWILETCHSLQDE